MLVRALLGAVQGKDLLGGGNGLVVAGQRAQAGDAVEQRVHVELVQALALDQHPVVIMADQQFALVHAGVEGGGIGLLLAEKGRSLVLELEDVDRYGSGRIELSDHAVGQQHIGTQGAAQVGERGAQRGPGLQFGCVAPEDLCQRLTGVPVGVEDQVGEQGLFFARPQADCPAVLLQFEQAKK